MTILGLMGGLAVWLVCEVVGEAVFEGVWRVLPRRVSRLGMIAWWLLTIGAMWGALAWWRADPASDLRTGLACFGWVILPVVGLGVTLVARDGAAERALGRAEAGAGRLRNERPRAR